MELWEWDLRAPARTWRFDEVVGCVALQASGELLLGLERGLCSFDVSSGAITLVTPFEEGRDTRPNDGRCGPMLPAGPQSIVCGKDIIPDVSYFRPSPVQRGRLAPAKPVPVHSGVCLEFATR